MRRVFCLSIVFIIKDVEISCFGKGRIQSMPFLMDLILNKSGGIWLREGDKLISLFKILGEFEIIVLMIDKTDVMIVRSLERSILIGSDNIELSSNIRAMMQPCNDFWIWRPFIFIIGKYLITNLKISHALCPCRSLNKGFLWKAVCPISTID